MRRVEAIETRERRMDPGDSNINFERKREPLKHWWESGFFFQGSYAFIFLNFLFFKFKYNWHITLY